MQLIPKKGDGGGGAKIMKEGRDIEERNIRNCKPGVMGRNGQQAKGTTLL